MTAEDGSDDVTESDGAAGDPPEPADDAEPAEFDDTVEAAVERVTGATAELPDEAAIDDSLAEAPDDVGGESRTEASDDVDPDSTADTSDNVDAAPTVGEADAEPMAGGPAAEDAVHAPTEAETRVLEFTLGEERFCIDIEYVEEIVKDKSVTRVPNTPAYVEGVVDLRGQITTILNPKVLFDAGETRAGGLLVVFDDETFEEGSHIGWVVDDVRQVSPVTEAAVTEAPVDAAHVTGVIDRDDGDFVVWTSPEGALEEAT